MLYRFSCIIGLVLLLGGCSTGPDISRDNINDPGSENFIPNAPASQDKVITKEKFVVLSWADQTDFEEGYLIEKKIYSEDPFQTLDTLAANATTYTDSSRQLAPGTSYRISSFVYSESNISKDSSKTIDLDLNSLGDARAYDDNDQIRVRWENSLDYYDGLIIGYKDLTNKPEEIIFADTLTPDVVSLRQINGSKSTAIPTPAEGFRYEIIVKATILTPDDEYEPYSTVSATVSVNAPVITSVQFQDEEHAEISWENSVPNISGFKISIVEYTDPEGSKMYNTEITETASGSRSATFSYPFKTGNYIFGIAAEKNGNFSKLGTTEFSFEVPSPQNLELSHENNAISLDWSLPGTSIERTNIIVERSLDDAQNFEELALLDANATQYSDPNVQPDGTIYNYRIKSTSSVPSKTVGLSNQSSLELEREVSISSAPPDPVDKVTRVTKSNNERYIQWINSDRNTLYVLDLDLESVIEIPLGDFLYRYSFFSNNSTRIFIQLRNITADTDHILTYSLTEQQEISKIELDEINPSSFAAYTEEKIVGAFNSALDRPVKLIDVITGEEELLLEVNDNVDHLFIDRENDRLIFFTRDTDELYTYDLKNRELVNSVEVSSIIHGLHPRLSHDKKSIIFEDGYILRSVDINTGERTKLLEMPYYDRIYNRDSIEDFIEVDPRNIFIIKPEFNNEIYLYNKSLETMTIPLPAIDGEPEKFLIDYFIGLDRVLMWTGNNILFYRFSDQWVTVDPN